MGNPFRAHSDATSFCVLESQAPGAFVKVLLGALVLGPMLLSNLSFLSFMALVSFDCFEAPTERNQASILASEHAWQSTWYLLSTMPGLARWAGPAAPNTLTTKPFHALDKNIGLSRTAL